jgi:hypothetical protein
MRGFDKVPESIHGDRRSRQRFSLCLPMEFRTESASGTGKVVDLSQNGIAFTLTPAVSEPAASQDTENRQSGEGHTSAGRVQTGQRFTASVALPVEAGIRLARLVLQCEVVREGEGVTAARILARSFEPAVGPTGLAAGAGRATR